MKTKTAGMMAIGVLPIFLAFGNAALADNEVQSPKASPEIHHKNLRITGADDCVAKMLDGIFQEAANTGLTERTVEGQELQKIKTQCVSSTDTDLGVYRLVHGVSMVLIKP